jgi:hypothetical protein
MVATAERRSDATQRAVDGRTGSNHPDLLALLYEPRLQQPCYAVPSLKKLIDLHPSQWDRERHRQPFFGQSGRIFLILFLLAFPVSAAATLLVTGELPYWLQHLLG